jgi:peptidoglycan hydrolase-like protein with peptidoglycan-binding domain
MRDVIDDEGPAIRPASVFAVMVMAIISVAVVYNTLLAQGHMTRQFAAPRGAAIRLDVDAGTAAGNTIRLKYDPVVEEVQRQLLAGGYYKGVVDGVVGKKTRQAIQAYQQVMGLEATGEPSDTLAEHIRYTREIAEASLFTGTMETNPDAAMRAQIRRVQTGLAELAYSPGKINGDLTDQTRAAIKLFQHDRGLDQTGEISGPLLTELGKLSGQSELNSD